MVSDLFKEYIYTELSYGLTTNKEDAKDLYQEWALAMLEVKQDTIDRLISEGTLERYARMVMAIISKQRYHPFHKLKRRKQYFEGNYSTDRTLSDEALELLDALDNIDSVSYERDKNRFVFEMFLKHGDSGKLATCRQLSETLKDQYGIDLHFTTLQYRKKKHIESIKKKFKRLNND